MEIALKHKYTVYKPVKKAGAPGNGDSTKRRPHYKKMSNDAKAKLHASQTEQRVRYVNALTGHGVMRSRPVR